MKHINTNGFHFKYGVRIFSVLVNGANGKFKYVVCVRCDASEVARDVVQGHAARQVTGNYHKMKPSSFRILYSKNKYQCYKIDIIGKQT